MKNFNLYLRIALEKTLELALEKDPDGEMADTIRWQLDDLWLKLNKKEVDIVERFSEMLYQLEKEYNEC